MREIVLVAAGLIIGGFFGVTTMCLFQINRDRHLFTERTAIKMSKRNIEKHILMNKAEAQDLQKKAKRACLSEGGLIRLLLKGYEPREKPDERFYDVMRELSAIGNNINQLAAKANTLGFVDAPQLKKEAERWHKFQADVERTFLRPDKSDMKWQ